MQWGNRRRGVVQAIALVVAACGGDETGQGGNAGPSGCKDYVTADGYTCCCGESFCTRTPGCRRGDAEAVSPLGSDSGPNGVVGTDGGRGGPYPAPHAALPEVASRGGPVLHAPRLVPIFFRGDALEPDLEAFMAALPKSSYWAAATAEYGVGDVTVAPSVVVSDAAPASMTDRDVFSWLATRIDGQSAGFPPATAEDVYMLFVPETTTVLATGGKSCVDFGGYHADAIRRITAGGSGGALDAGGSSDSGAALDAGAPVQTIQRFVYAVIDRCPERGGGSQFDSLTTAISHELIEASTDPFVRSRPAYTVIDAQYAAWEHGITLEPLSELADVCLYDGDPAFFGQYAVQRAWSNRAAAAGLDPCVPAGRNGYYAAAPDTLDQVPFEGGTVLGVSVPVGTSRTLDIRLFSTSPVPDWTVFAGEGPMSAPGTSLTFAWNEQIGNNGDVLKLTVSRVADGPIGGASVFLLYSGSVGQSALDFVSAWPVLVTN